MSSIVNSMTNSLLLTKGSFNTSKLASVMSSCTKGYSSSASPTRQRLDFSQDPSTTRERNRTVTSYYNQSAIDLAAAKVKAKFVLCVIQHITENYPFNFFLNTSHKYFLINYVLSHFAHWNLQIEVRIDIVRYLEGRKFKMIGIFICL